MAMVTAVQVSPQATTTTRAVMTPAAADKTFHESMKAAGVTPKADGQSNDGNAAQKPVHTPVDVDLQQSADPQSGVPSDKAAAATKDSASLPNDAESSTQSDAPADGDDGAATPVLPGGVAVPVNTSIPAAGDSQDSKVVGLVHGHVAGKQPVEAPAVKSKHGKPGADEANVAVSNLSPQANAQTAEGPAPAPRGAVSTMVNGGEFAQQNDSSPAADKPAPPHSPLQLQEISGQSSAKVNEKPVTNVDAPVSSAKLDDSAVAVGTVTPVDAVKTEAAGTTVVHSTDLLSGVAGTGNHHAPQSSSVASVPHEGTAMRSAARDGNDWTLQSYEAPSSNRLEIGVSGGSLGWLKVRAELVQGGGVHTYLRGGNAAAESELRAQSSDLQAYLNTQQMGTHTIHVETSRASSWNTDTGGFTGSQEQGSRDEARGRQARNAGDSAVQDSAFSGTLADGMNNIFLPPVRGNGAGGWLNVLA